MKKNIDPNKVSNFKNTEINYHHHSTFCMKTKPNNRYFNGLIKEATKEMKDNLCTEELKQKNPGLFYSILGRKLPKKYLQKEKVQITPVNAHIPEQSKLSPNELQLQLETEAKQRKLKAQKEYDLRQEQRKKELIKERNQKALLREQSYIQWVNPFEPINKNKMGSSQAWRIEKKYKYYD